MTYKKSLICLTVATLCSGASTVAFAADENEAESVERIAVTGSRISRAEVSSPNPVVTIEAAEIARFGSPDLGSILAEYPAIGATDTLVGNSGSNAFAGVSSADLRRLGASRTLVLVNGKRHVAGAAGSAQVDLSTIPAALIKSVEILTGGASAVYGSDAVSGVVNVILKDDYEGLEFSVTGGESTESVDDGYHTISFIGGGDIGEKGNVVVYGGYERLREVMANDLRQLDDWGTISNDASNGEDDGIADRIRVPNVVSERIDENGVLNPFGGPGSIWTFADDGTPVVQQDRQGNNSFAFGYFPDGCDHCFELNDYQNITPSVEKFNVGTTFKYALNDNVNFYSDVKYVTADIKQQFQPSFRFGNVTINVEENAFLDDTLRQTLLADGTTSISMAKFFQELGNRSADNKRETFRFVGGFNGDFTLSETDFNYDLFYNYGETNNRRRTLNDLIPGNFAAAVDSIIDPVTGEAVCRDGSAASINGGDCVAYNPFGYDQASQAAKDFVSANTTREDGITQEVIGGFVAFDTSEFLNTQGGPISLAVGFEYREETSETITDELTKSGLLAGAATPDEYGEYDVTEGFIEISVPLIKEKDFIEELSVGGAYRYADYSHAGNVDAWKVDLLWAPVDTFRIRTTYSEAVRAPNIVEAFSPQSPGFANIDDPCDADNISDDPDRAANCAALGIPAGFEANDNVSIDLISGGNPNLTPEESESLTVGFTWEPSFVEDLSMTLDYYDIEITDAIEFIDAQDVIDNCVDASGGPDSGFCSQVDRDPTSNDISLVRSGYLNAAARNTSGYEAQVFYTLDGANFDIPGEFKFNFLLNYLEELELFSFQDRPDEIDVENGEVGDPEWQGRLSTSYVLDEMSFNWTTRFVDRSATFDVSPGGGSPEDLSPAFVPTNITHDLAFGWDVNENLAISAGMRNVFDKLPPGWLNPRGANSAIYDGIGRRVYGGISFRF
ncbi:TonB-dependent receptor [uncultured Ferrimonas sp.]|uniref:TonB-dependent receptor domain-containing protein n=1 Tax=uncultured Ferrimonas sp. TaxID=432640 RepID=UPI00261199A4|nr:TonB-dependent receptor [uncultured Ferrimonas sp.]